MNRNQVKAHNERITRSIEGNEIIQGFMDHFRGNKELSLSQINVGNSLLDRVAPKLRSVDMNVDGDVGLQIEVINYSEAQNPDD